MYKFEEFAGEPAEFWHEVRLVSQELGYATRATKRTPSSLLVYTAKEVSSVFQRKGYSISPQRAAKLAAYSVRRAEAAERIRTKLMDVTEAAALYEEISARVNWAELGINPPMNKQKGDKKAVSYLTAMVDLLSYEVAAGRWPIVYDPRGLLEFSDAANTLNRVSSRRFDGAIPSLQNPLVVWEIKEYYYTTTFGSRIADGIYESRLDGLEFAELPEAGANKPAHVLFVDSYSVWWIQGKSYLCRLIDCVNEGTVDDIFFGREVSERWPSVLAKILDGQEDWR